MHPFVEFVRRKTYDNYRHRRAIRWLRKSGLEQHLRAISTPGRFKPAEYDLWLLYRTILKLRPRITLEFGLGNSSISMAMALRDGGINGRIVSVDASEFWVSEFKRLCPADLAPFIDVHYSPVEVTTHEGERCHRYVNVPDIRPEFIYLDGPDPKDVPGWEGDVKAMDPLAYFTLPGAKLMIDARFENVAFLDRHMKGRRKKTVDEIFKIITYDRLGPS